MRLYTSITAVKSPNPGAMRLLGAAIIVFRGNFLRRGVAGQAYRRCLPRSKRPLLPIQSIDLHQVIATQHEHEMNLLGRGVQNVNVAEVVCAAKCALELADELSAGQIILDQAHADIKLLLDSPERSDALVAMRTKRANVHTLRQNELKARQRACLMAAKLPNSTHPMSPATEPRELGRLGPDVDSLPVPPSPRSHLDLCQSLDLADFDAGTKATGPSFYYLKHEAALLELALINYAIRTAVDCGFTPVSAPDIVRAAAVVSCGFAPRDSTRLDCYALGAPDDGLMLAATAEIPLAAMHAGATLLPAHLPLRMVAFGRAFRREAGNKGTATRGLLRVHQFSKVELFALAHPLDSERMFSEILQVQRQIVTGLGLTSRILEMPATDLGAAAHRKVDIETWLPGRRAWCEISSASNCTDYQSRRLDIRLLENPGMDSRARGYVHTLNGTAVAIPRLIVAILEQFQNENGSVRVPLVLQQYLGCDIIPHP